MRLPNVNINKTLNYILMYLLVAFSGIPFFYKAGLKFMLPSVILAISVFIYRKYKFDRFFAFYIIYFIIILIAQMMKFYYLPISTYIGILLIISFGYFIVRILGNDFSSYYIDVLYVSTIIGLFFYFISYIPGVERFLITNIASIFSTSRAVSAYKVWPHFIVYTINTGGAGGGVLRNSGPFWEPGANAGFLVVGIILNFIQTKSLTNKKSKVLILGLLSTMSTTGIVALLIVISAYVMANATRWVKIIFVPSAILIGFIAYNSIDILGSKIEDKMDVQGNTYNTRFGSAILDLKDLAENPLLGLGKDPLTRHKGSTDAHANHRNNGVTGHLVNYGIITFLLYFYFIYYSFKKLCIKNKFRTNFAYYSIFLIFLVGFSEMYFGKPFFYALTFVHLGIEFEKNQLINEPESLEIQIENKMATT